MGSDRSLVNNRISISSDKGKNAIIEGSDAAVHSISVNKKRNDTYSFSLEGTKNLSKSSSCHQVQRFRFPPKVVMIHNRFDVLNIENEAADPEQIIVTENRAFANESQALLLTGEKIFVLLALFPEV